MTSRRGRPILTRRIQYPILDTNKFCILILVGPDMGNALQQLVPIHSNHGLGSTCRVACGIVPDASFSFSGSGTRFLAGGERNGFAGAVFNLSVFEDGCDFGSVLVGDCGAGVVALLAGVSDSLAA